jgi:thiamine transporter
MSFITSEGGLTRAGYVLFVILALVAFIIGAIIAGRATQKKKMRPKQLVFCAMGLALAFALSYIRIIHLPYGGAATLLSMLMIVLVAYWYGPATGVLVGFAYGILQFIQEPYFLSVLQVCMDYLFAFSALGLAGFFRKKKNGLVIGYIVAVLARGFFHAVGGYMFWMEYMPDNFPKSLSAIYPIVYNYSFLLTEALITVIVISIPSVKNALARVQKMALE